MALEIRTKTITDITGVPHTVNIVNGIDRQDLHFFNDKWLENYGHTHKNKNYTRFLKLLRPGCRTFADVGSNIGQITIDMMSDMTGPAAQRYVAFEPTPETHACLLENLRVRDLTQRGVVHFKFVSSEVGTVYMKKVTSSAGANYGFVGEPKPGTKNVFSAEMIRFDDLALTDVDVMKIDVEGFEIDVIRGAKNTIALTQPVIQCEVYEPAAKRANKPIQNLYDEMLSIDYFPIIVDHGVIEIDKPIYSYRKKCVERFFVHNSELSTIQTMIETQPLRKK